MMGLNVNNRYLRGIIPDVVFRELNIQVQKLNFIGGGSNGLVYGAVTSDGRKIAVKAFREKGAMRKESNQLMMLSKYTSANMPEVIFEYDDGETALMGMTFLKGRNVLNPLFVLKNKVRKEKFANDIADIMIEWHSVKASKYGDINNPEYESWKEYYINEKQKPFLDGISKLVDQGKFSRKNFMVLKDATEIYNMLPDESEAPVLIHGDLNIMNIMANPKNLDLIGIIDPCGSIYADKEYDMFQLRNMWGDVFGLYDAYKSKVKISEYTDFRVAYYGAMNEAACRIGGGIHMPLWEILCNMRLKKELKKLKEKM